jgi:integrase
LANTRYAGFRTIVLIALCFGLRISEILGLRWTEFDFKRSVVLIQRSAVGKRLNKLKTEYSQNEVPLKRGFILELRKWQMLCLDSEGVRTAERSATRKLSIKGRFVGHPEVIWMPAYP